MSWIEELIISELNLKKKKNQNANKKHKKYKENWRINNREKDRESKKNYKIRNSEKTKEQNRIYRENNKEKIRQYYINNKHIISERNKISYRKMMETITHFDYETKNNKNKRYVRALALKVINVLGGKCVECGYDKDTRALQVDHIHSDGAFRRKHIYKGSYSRNADIVKNGGQGIYQLLCANCNVIKRDENNEYSKKKRPRKYIPI